MKKLITLNYPYSEHNLQQYFVHYIERQFLWTCIEAFHQNCSLYGDVHYIEYSLYGELTVLTSELKLNMTQVNTRDHTTENGTNIVQREEKNASLGESWETGIEGKN